MTSTSALVTRVNTAEYVWIELTDLAAIVPLDSQVHYIITLTYITVTFIVCEYGESIDCAWRSQYIVNTIGLKSKQNKKSLYKWVLSARWKVAWEVA